ncbi:hypothetical protein AMTR_s00007p00144780 [Amborella trichopoda]|uniref:cellulase n=1 Tax=Amborella trichopoda TaxID=13333 RepID=W1PC70_AMBTC|nr:hypothetical protein AMTR_s00007p00144780 [Amborella trichopoda]
MEASLSTAPIMFTSNHRDDLVGGYYIDGDNVKYSFPMAFTVTMLAWSVVEYSNELQTSNELSHAMEAIRWGTDYFIKAQPKDTVLYAVVGDPILDHACWERPEDMTTSRQAYRIDEAHPGADLAGETAAALAASSMVFKSSDSTYALLLLDHAKRVSFHSFLAFFFPEYGSQSQLQPL